MAGCVAGNVFSFDMNVGACAQAGNEGGAGWTRWRFEPLHVGRWNFDGSREIFGSNFCARSLNLAVGISCW